MADVNVPTDRLLRIPEVAAHLACSRGTVYRLINRGDLQSVRILADQRVPAASVSHFLSRLTTAGKGE